MRTIFRKELKRFACLGLAAVVSATTVPVDFGGARNVVTVEAASTSTAQQELVTRFQTEVSDVFSNAKSTFSSDVSATMKKYKNSYGTETLLQSIHSDLNVKLNNLGNDVIKKCNDGVKAGNIAGRLETSDLEAVDTYLTEFIAYFTEVSERIDKEYKELSAAKSAGTQTAAQYNANFNGVQALYSNYTAYKSSAQDDLITLKKIKSNLESTTNAENSKNLQNALSYLNKGIAMYKSTDSKVNALKNTNFSAYFAGKVVKDKVDSEIVVENLSLALDNFKASMANNNNAILYGDLEIFKKEVIECRRKITISTTMVRTLQSLKEYSSLDAETKKAALAYAEAGDELIESFATCLDSAIADLNQIVVTATQKNPVSGITVRNRTTSQDFTSYKDYNGNVWVDFSEGFNKSGYHITGIKNKTSNKVYSGTYVRIPAYELNSSGTTEFEVQYVDYCDVFIDYDGGKDASGNIGNVREFSSESELRTARITKVDYPATNGNLELNALCDMYEGDRASHNARLSAIDLDVFKRDYVYLKVLWYDTSTTPTSTPTATTTPMPTPSTEPTSVATPTKEPSATPTQEATQTPTTTPTQAPANTVQVILLSDGGTFTNGTNALVKNYEPGSIQIIKSEDFPTKQGYVFDGFTSVSRKDVTYMAADNSYIYIVPAQNDVLTAKWKKVDNATTVPTTTAAPIVPTNGAVTTATPSAVQTATPTAVVTTQPTQTPTQVPTTAPTATATVTPTQVPTTEPTPVVVPTPETPSYPAFTLNKSKVTLGKGEKVTLNAKSVQTGIEYKSGNSSVATVNANGQVVAKGKGTAYIFVTANNTTKKVKITVKAAPKKVTIKKAKITLKKGKKATIKYSLSKGSYGKVTFSSSNKKIVSVSSTGKITAKKKGTAKIKIKTYNGKTDTVKVIVK